MFDLGRTFLAAIERSSDALAVVDSERRLSYAQWGCEIAGLTRGLAALGLKRGNRLAVILQNRIEMASLHWACQLAGIVMTPLNWRIKAEELNYCLSDADAAAVVFDQVGADAVSAANAARVVPRVAIGGAEGGTCGFTELAAGAADPGQETCRWCSILRERPVDRKACRGVIAPSAPRRWRISRRTPMSAPSARSV